ncbi:MAG: proprotein convertase P-domain-containing protein [Saprospiraceae bacterium]|nr:proprotein convertase P-domain-containing protein [Saprospiraceae bacterium]
MILRFFTLYLLTITTSGYLLAQKWSLTDPAHIEDKGIKDLQPSRFLTYAIDDIAMRNMLWSAPHEKDTDVHKSSVEISVMLADGTSDIFRVVQYDMMEAGLAQRYPDIRTFYGVSVTNVYRYIRIDYTEQGFRAVIKDENRKIFIDHYQRGDLRHRIVYFRSDYQLRPTWGCNFNQEEHAANEDRNSERSVLIGDCQLRSYRLAQTATGEFSQLNGGTPISVMSAVVTVINRVNEVYEAEVAVRLILVNNTDQIFYYNAATDPFTGNNASTMLQENITNTNLVIGSANYDIGHIFGGSGNNGVAFLGSVCGQSKAGGVTTSSTPFGDPFSIDYVAHEMGHQFGGSHTQYNNCNRSSASAMEPGSASTIMGYAGICSPNVQNNSDAYFHARSLDQIKTFLLAGGNGCSQIVGSFINTAPSVTAQSNYSIPVSTPFVLTLNATDAQGHPITYAWEQMNSYSNPAQTMPPAATNVSGPVFRSIIATSSPSRYFPPLTNVLANSTNTWQVLPSVARTLNFRGVARDFTGVAGCNNEINITVSTVGAANGAFSVTSNNTASTWLEGESRTITWNVAGSNAGQINAPNVDILLSYNGGQTFPVVLASGTPNDGTQQITVPQGTTTQGRIMVRGTNHIFYDINNANITINPGGPNFALTITPGSQSFCAGDSKQYTVSVQSILGFNSPVTLSLAGLPTGMTANFATNPVIPGGNSILTITNNSASTGNTNFTVTGINGANSKNVNGTVQILPVISAAPSLSSPANNASNVVLPVSFSWTAVTNATSYDLEISLTNTFENIVTNTNVPTTNYSAATGLDGLTQYFWRVRAVNLCGSGSWSAIRNFTTQACFIYSASDLPIVILPDNGEFVNSYLDITDRGIITDLDILSLSGTHTYIGDLTFSLFNPGEATSVLFWNRPCNNNQFQDFNINFDQSAPVGSWPCPPTNGGTYRPSNTLVPFNTLQMKGKWRLHVVDNFDQDGGTLQSWGIKTCVTDFCRLTVNNNLASGVGSLPFALNCAQNGDTIRFAQGFINQTIDLGTNQLNVFANLTIEADPAANIHVISSGTNATISTNGTVKISGLHIHAPSATKAAIENKKGLTLENVTLYNYPGGSGIMTLINAGVLNIIGYCDIID